MFSPQWQLRHQNRNSPRSLCEHARIFEPRGFVDERLDNGGLIKIHTRPLRAAPRKYQLDLEIAKKSNFSKLAQNEALWALVTKILF